MSTDIWKQKYRERERVKERERESLCASECTRKEERVREIEWESVLLNGKCPYLCIFVNWSCLIIQSYQIIQNCLFGRKHASKYFPKVGPFIHWYKSGQISCQNDCKIVHMTELWNKKLNSLISFHLYSVKQLTVAAVGWALVQSEANVIKYKCSKPINWRP